MPIHFHKLIIVVVALFITTNLLLSREIHSDKCGLSLFLNPSSRNELQRSIKYTKDNIPDVGQKYYISKNNLFKIYYDTVGYNAPSLIDNDNNGVPDYIDSVAFYFEYAYEVQVNQIGYRSPIPDKGNRGSDHYDVYIWDLGNSNEPNEDPYDRGGLYGITMWTDKDIITYEPFQRNYSYIVIDNNYSPTDSVRILNSNIRYPAYKETGINALKITISHEFQHAIQFMYGLSYPATITIMEMCGVAMEFRLFPETRDYLQYIKNIFSNLAAYPFGVDNNQTGYGFSIFAKYVIQNYGDKIFKNMWELVGNNVELYKALDSSFTINHLSFSQEWQKFTLWIYYTGARAIPNEYFDNAAELPEIKFDRTNLFSPPAVSNTRGTRSLEVGAVRYVVKGKDNREDDTLDILYSNTDIQSASEQYQIFRDYSYTLTNIDDGRILLDKLGLFLEDNSNKNYIKSQYIQRVGETTKSIDYAYPNPFNPNSNEYIYFPSPKDAKLYDNATLVIYNTEMLPLYTQKGTIGVNNNKRVFSSNEINLQNGIYIYGVHTKDNYTIGKLTILRK